MNQGNTAIPIITTSARMHFLSLVGEDVQRDI